MQHVFIVSLTTGHSSSVGGEDNKQIFILWQNLHFAFYCFQFYYLQLCPYAIEKLHFKRFVSSHINY